MMDIRSAARALEGDVIAGGQVVFRAPGHSRADRSASVRFGPKFGPDDPDDFMVNSFAGDPFDALRDHVKERLLGSARWPCSPRSFIRDETPSEDREDEIRKAEAFWNRCLKPEGTLAEKYLNEERQLALTSDVAGSVIRYKPDCPWRDDQTAELLQVPAMICVLRNIQTDRITGIHKRRLTPEGRKVGKPKMRFVAAGSAIKIDADETVSHGLGIAEGVETALSARQLGWRPMWAGGSEGAIKTFPVLSGVECITLHAEHDENGTNERAIHECASRWHAANREVIVVHPKVGKDLNDALGGTYA
jgi:hypothetical protein